MDKVSVAVVTVNARPVVTCPANSSVCLNATAFALTGGSMAGGTYSGTGVSAGTFNPAAAGTGTHTIAYTYINTITGCTNSCTFTITVTAPPTVTLSASPYTKLFPGLSTTLTASILPSSTGFTISWYQNNTLIPGVTGTTYSADLNKLGAYRVDIVNATTGCNSQSNVVTIADSVSSRLFIFPSPNNGQFSVSYYNSGGGSTNRTVTVYDSKGARVYYQQFAIGGPYTILGINLGAAQRGVYYVVVGDADNKPLHLWSHKL